MPYTRGTLRDMDENDYEATAAHDSADQPLEHIGEPVQDPALDGAARPAATDPAVSQPEGPQA